MKTHVIDLILNHKKYTNTRISLASPEMSADIDQNRGRPTKQEQVIIELELRPLYEKSISASVASRQTGHNIKTVLKYYNQWTDEILEMENKDFLKRCKNEKERSILALDGLMITLNKEIDDVDKTITMLKENGNYVLAEKFIKLKIKLADEISGIVTKKLAITNSPTFDSMSEIRKLVDVN